MAGIRSLIIFIGIFVFSYGFTEDKPNIDEVSSYLNNFSTMFAEFTQINSNGEEKSGTIKIKRPGKLRIEYNDPSSLLIICDGIKLAVINKSQKNITLYSKEQLPIGMFLNDDFSIKNYKVINFSSEANIIRLEISKQGLENQQTIVFFFEEKPMILKKWIIKSTDGSQTEMYLSKLLINEAFDKKNFVISDPRKLPFGRRE